MSEFLDVMVLDRRQPGITQPIPSAVDLQALLADPYACPNPIQLSCVDCGRDTDRFCDGEERQQPDGSYYGNPCLA